MAIKNHCNDIVEHDSSKRICEMMIKEKSLT
jgi:hypothetical protein